MKKIKLFLVLMLLPLLFSNNVFAKEEKINAEVSRQKILFDGKEIDTIEAYNIEGNNYFKLRDVAALVSGTEINFDVSFNETRRSVEITRDTAYKKQKNDLVKKVSDSKLDVRNAKPVCYIDNEKVLYKGYLINNNNFFRLRDLGKTIGFYVSYDKDEDAVIIKSEKLEPKDLIEREEVTIVNLYSDPIANSKKINNSDKKISSLTIDDFIKDLKSAILITDKAKRLSVIEKSYDKANNNIVLIPDFKYKGKLFLTPVLKVEQDSKTSVMKLENENISFDLLKNKAGIDPNKGFKLTLGYYEGDEEDHNFRFLSLIEISY